MIRLAGLVLILLLAFSGRALSQDIFITGHVVNKETNAPLDNVSIKLYNGTRIIYTTISDTAGTFKINQKLYRQTSYIIIHGLNLADLRVDGLPQPKDNNNIGIFKLSTRNIQLKNVEVRAKRRYHDTTTIDLSKQNFERSVTVNDLLSKEHGFYRDNNGQLYYKGKVVSDLVVNGSDFFGKNNMDIYKLLPALALEDIQVVETNVDSVTNTTVLRPVIKVNLRLKEKYSSGKFGNASLGIGSADRYIASTDLYTYKKREQISVGFNNNNINITNNPYQEPAISFSPNTNSVSNHSARITYSNMLGKKIELDFSATGRIENRDFTSETERQDQVINQFSKIFSKSDSKLSGISGARLNIKYHIDSLNTLNFTQTNSYDKTNNTDSSNYSIRYDSITNVSNLNRVKHAASNLALTELLYTHRFASKKGRALNVKLSISKNDIKNDERDNIYNLSNNTAHSYFVSNNRKLSENSFDINSDFNEPLGDDAYFNIYSSYKSDRLNYNSDMISDSSFLFLNNQPAGVINNYGKSGIKFQKTFRKISVDGSISGLIDLRTIVGNKQDTHISLFNLNADLKADYKLSDSKNFSFIYKTLSRYPEANQIINVNNTFDLISQTSGNAYLKPETDNSFKVSYSLKRSTSSINIDAGIDFYESKFGMDIQALPNTIQTTFIDNVGRATAVFAGVSVQKNMSDKFYFNYNSNIVYQEQPTIINDKLNINNSVALNEVFSLTKEVIKNVLTISPIVTAGYTKYYYENSSVNIVSLTYSDKLSFTALKFKLDLFPLINYNHGINSLTSFSMNGAIKRSLFNDYAIIWLQGYDLFNSFKYNNNLLGSSYAGTVKYSNVQRYFIVGLSFKFNNIK
ncbi:TonB-dependent receptor [Mucilaginibacter sp. FT3.2]|uniref:TonB-dependent receptor n=1 Tax=Mucilaginibacter sp. FT3.2 TaxID=2723090 RepID=UPI00161BB310|nr:TonB-dependent receptor [Mucilaginibacter sp. FT3.2]MBB6230678.1 hypothetical protein [Mucilaginibacter sp. FT3.2]